MFVILAGLEKVATFFDPVSLPTFIKVTTPRKMHY